MSRGPVTVVPGGTGTGVRAVRFAAEAVDGPDGLLRAVDELTGGARLLRDVTIGMPGDASAQLVAEQGDFWFHTDAAFLPVPPRWMVIAVLEADDGGGLDLLPVELIDSAALSVRASYLTPEGYRVTPVLEQLPGDRVGRRIRYRRDRMRAAGSPSELEAAHEAVRAASPARPSPASCGRGSACWWTTGPCCTAAARSPDGG